LATRLRTLATRLHVLLALHDFLYISVLQIFFLLHAAVPRLSFFFNYLISHLSVPLTFLAFQGDKCTLTEVVANVDIDPYGEYCEWSELSVTQLIKLLFVLL
jgi:hypothetical protein